MSRQVGESHTASRVAAESAAVDTDDPTAPEDGVAADSAKVPASAADLGGAARNGMIALAGAGVAAVAGLLLNVVIGRAFGAGASGVFFSAVAILTVAGTVTKLGGDTGLVWALARARALGREREVRPLIKVALVPSLLAGTGSAILVFLMAPVLAKAIGGQPELEGMLRSSAPFLVVAAPCMVLAAGLRGMGGVVAFTGVQNVLVPGLRPVLAGVTTAVGLGVSAALFTWNATFVVGIAAAVLLTLRQTRRIERRHRDAPPPRETAQIRREFWRFSSPRAVTSGLEVALVWTDVLIVAALTSPREAGIYAAVSRFILAGTLAEGAMRVAMAADISKLLAVGDLAGAGRLCATVTQWTVLLSWPLYLILALYGPTILSVFGEGFSEGWIALSILAVAMLAVMAAGNNQTVLLMSGRSGLQLFNRCLALGGNILLNLWLVPLWGMQGAAIAWAITWVTDAGLVLAEVRWGVGLRRRRGLVWPVALAAVAAFVPLGLATRALASGGVWASVVAATVSVVIFAGLLYLIRGRLDVAPLRRAVSGRRAATE